MLALAMMCAGPIACAEDTKGYTPPEIGTQFFWKYETSEGVEDDVYTVVASGPDFVIFENEYDGEKIYNAEFSGIGGYGCFYGNPPSRADRQKLFSNWPPEPGKEFQFNGTEFVILKPSNFESGEINEDVLWYEERESEIHRSENSTHHSRFAMSLQRNTLLEILWGDGNHDTVTKIETPETEILEVQKGYKIAAGFDFRNLQNCAALLSEHPPITGAESSE